MARAHPIAAVIEDAPRQQGLGFHPSGSEIAHLFVELGLHRVEQIAIDDGRPFADQYFAFEAYFTDVESIAQQVGERPAREWNAPDRLAGLQRAHLGDDAAPAQL